MGRFEKSERFFFYPEGRTYSPLAKQAVVLLKQTCALRGLRLRWSLAEAAAEPSPSVRLPVRQPHFLFMKKKQKFCPKGVIYKNGDLSFRSKSHQSQLR